MKAVDLPNGVTKLMRTRDDDPEKKRSGVAAYVVAREHEEIEKAIRKEYPGLDFKLDDNDWSALQQVLITSIFRQQQQQRLKPGEVHALRSDT